MRAEEADPNPRKPTADDERAALRSGRLAGLSMWRAIWVLSWPVLIQSSLQSLVGLVDTALAAGISTAATDAIGVASYFMWFIALVGMSLGVGATALVSRSFGRGRLAVANAVVGQTVLAAASSGIVVGAFIWLAAPWIATLLTLSGEAYDGAVAYLRIAAFGVPLFNIIAGGAACARGAGDAIRPLLIMAAVNVVNIGVSFILAGVDIATTTLDEEGRVVRQVLLEHPSGSDLGVLGIAYGTLAAWVCGAIAMLLVLTRGFHGVRLRAKRLRLHMHTMRRLVRVGLPNFFETMGLWLGNFVLILMVGWIGIDGLLGAHVVAVRVEAFSFLPGFAMGMAAATLTGQYLGAGSEALARRAVLRCTALASAIMLGFGVAFLTIPERIVGVFSQQALHLEVTPRLLFICGAIQIPFAIAIVIRSALRGAGDTRAVMTITLLMTYGVRVPLAWFCSGADLALPGDVVLDNPLPIGQWLGLHPLEGIWLGLCSEIAVRAVAFGIRFTQRGWALKRI